CVVVGRPILRSVDSEVKGRVLSPESTRRLEPSSWTQAGAVSGNSLLVHSACLILPGRRARTMTTRVSKEPERPRRFHRKSGWGDRNRQLPGPRWDAHDRGEQTTGDPVVSAREEFERVETDGGESERRLMKTWSCASCAFLPISLRRFPSVAKAGHHFSPPCEGGAGGVVPARPVTGASHALFLSVLSHHSREARRIGLDLQGSPITPPTPPSQGGERESNAKSFQRAQQKHATRNRPSSSVNTHFSSPHPPPAAAA